MPETTLQHVCILSSVHNCNKTAIQEKIFRTLFITEVHTSAIKLFYFCFIICVSSFTLHFGNFVGGHGKIGCIIRLSKCCCNTVSGQKHDELFWITPGTWLDVYYLFCYF